MNKKRSRELLKELNTQKKSLTSRNEPNGTIEEEAKKKQQQENEKQEENELKEQISEEIDSKIEEKDQIVRNFQCLDSIINQLANRKQLLVIDSVLESVSKMTGSHFTQQDLIVILTICPQAYLLNQATHQETIISINNQWPVNNNTSLNRHHVPIEARINQFRNEISSIDLNELKNTLPSNLLSFLPTNDNHFNDSSRSSETTQRKKLKTPSSSLREVVDLVATLQNLESEGNINIPTSLTSPSMSSSSTTTTTTTTTTIQSSSQIETLRSEIIQKSELQLERAKTEQETEAQLVELAVTILLPSVVDTLRTLSRSKSKTIFFVPEVVHVLTTSLRLVHNRNDSQDSGNSSITGLKLLHRLAQEASEFLTIFPGDEMVSSPTVRINLSAPLNEVKRRMKELSDSATAERERIRNRIQSIGLPFPLTLPAAAAIVK